MKTASPWAGCGWLLLPLATAVVAATPTPGSDEVVVALPAAPRLSVDIFAVRTWEPPPPAPPPTIDGKPPRPQAPPLPFKFLGRISEPGKAVAFMLAQGERILVVGVGAAIDSNYRVEKFENGKLFFRYRPMNVRQTLDVGNPS